MMVLNPKGHAKMAKKRRRKMSALQLQYFGKGRKRRAASRGSAKRRRSGGRVVIVSANPRGRHLSKRRRRSFRANPRSAHRRRFRRNPIGLGGFLNNTLIPAAVGAGGAMVVDYLDNQFGGYLPASLQTPTMKPLTDVGLSLLVGWGVSAVGGAKLGGEAAAGGIIVALYNFFNTEVAALGYGAGAGYGATGTGMNRYLGFIRRRNLGVNPVGVAPLNVASGHYMGGGPYTQTKWRVMRNGGASGRTLGYINPARTMGRNGMGRYIR